MMRIYSFLSILLSITWLLVSSTVAADELAAEATVGPHQVIENVTSTVIARIVEERPLYQDNPNHLHVIVEEELVPHVALKRIARRVMAKHFRNASTEQRNRFLAVFKNTLMNTYASGLAKYDNQEFSVLPASSGDIDGKRATVKMNVVLNSGTQILVAYALHLNKQSQWQVENIIIDGINLGVTYRNQFAEAMQKYGNIDQVIDHWDPNVATEESS